MPPEQMLKAIGVSCVVLVLAQHIPLEWWEGMLLGFGWMIILG